MINHEERKKIQNILTPFAKEITSVTVSLKEIIELERLNESLLKDNLKFIEEVSAINKELEESYKNDKSYWERLTEVFTPIILITVTSWIWAWIIYEMFILLTN